MINYIKGYVAQIGDGFIVLDNNGIGYLIGMPSTELFRLTEGMEATVFTYMAVREDDISLFGFTSAEDLELFKKLLNVSGVGPKGALGILSSIPGDELKMAIAAGDAKLISKSKGIGLKTAQKIIVELKDKFSKEAVVMPKSGASAEKSNDIETAIAFVNSTGVSRTECLKALNKAGAVDDLDVDALIDVIFKNLSI